jgi:hypothetical protein
VGKLHTEELLNVSYSEHGVGVTNLIRMRRVVQLAHMREIRNAYFFSKKATNYGITWEI